MEEVTFKAYLKYIEGEKLPVWRLTKKLNRYKYVLGLITILGVLSSMFLFALAFSEKYSFLFYKYKSVSLMPMLATSAIMFLFSRHRLIKNRITDLNEYYNYCAEFTNLLNRYDCATIQAVELLRERLLEHISEIETPHKELYNRIEKWVQVFVVPVILFVITKIVDISKNFSELEIFLFFALFFCIAICSITLFYLSLAWFSPKCELEQRKCFADDLQGILDLHRIRNSEEVIPCTKIKTSNTITIDTSVTPSKKPKRKHK